MRGNEPAMSPKGRKQTSDVTHKEFLEKGRPACMGQPQEKSEQSIEPERA
jgi:hypothetical protein